MNNYTVNAKGAIIGWTAVKASTLGAAIRRALKTRRTDKPLAIKKGETVTIIVTRVD